MRGKPTPAIIPLIQGVGLSSLTAQKGVPVTIPFLGPKPDTCSECNASSDPWSEPILVLDRDGIPCAVVVFDPDNPLTGTGWIIYPFSLVYGWIAEHFPKWIVDEPYKTCEVNAHPLSAIGGPTPGLFEPLYCIHCVKGEEQ